MNKRLFITLGEPAGIGPDIAIQLAQQKQGIECIVIGSSEVLQQRALTLNLSLKLTEFNKHDSPSINQIGELKIIEVPLLEPCEPGKLNKKNSPAVLKSLELAHELLIHQQADALLTLPVHKGILNEYGYPFSGHTEFFRDLCNSPCTVMLFVLHSWKIALASTHLPLKQVPDYLTKEKLSSVLNCLIQELKNKWQAESPKIGVCGLNPHAGEDGYFGREEIDCINPLIQQFQQQNHAVHGCFSADTLLTPEQLNQFDCILAMYHDQALPVVKFAGFGNAINITLGLPYWRISVDHGTALDKAGTGLARSGSAQAAIDFIAKQLPFRSI